MVHKLRFVIINKNHNIIIMRCKYIFLIGLLLIINNAFAQWHFSVSISSNSDCGDSFSAIQASVEVAARIGIVEQLSAKTYNSQEDCEAERRTCTMNYSNSGCYIRTTTTPCQGNVGGGSGGGFYGEPSLHNNLAIGSDYFSQNEVHNVENGIWENEMLVQNDVLNKNWYNAVGAKTGDNNYDSKYAEEVRRLIKKFSKEENTTNNYNFISRKEIDYDGELYVRLFDAPILDEEYYRGEANYENLKIYLDASERLTDMYLANPQNLEYILQKEFERVSGFNVTDILNKYPNTRTDEEWQILTDYGAFKMNKIEQMTRDINKEIDQTAEKKELDAAILALDCYGNDSEGHIKNTNYKKIDLNAFISSNEANPYLRALANTINKCNNTEDGTGMHVELYYNDLTNTYVISCAGTEDLWKDGVFNDGVIAVDIFGGDMDIPQYMMAKTIGDAINMIPQEERENFNIEVVGHSLGGGMASIIGLTTGIETKTFNAATVPDNFLKDNGLYGKVKDGDIQNITAYHASSDILTVAQETSGSPAIGVSVDIGNSQPEPIKSSLEPSRDMDASKVSDLAYDIAQGTTNGIREHSIVNVVDTMTKNNNEKVNKNPKLNTLNIAQKKLQFELEHIENIKNGF